MSQSSKFNETSSYKRREGDFPKDFRKDNHRLIGEISRNGEANEYTGFGYSRNQNKAILILLLVECLLSPETYTPREEGIFSRLFCRRCVRHSRVSVIKFPIGPGGGPPRSTLQNSNLITERGEYRPRFPNESETKGQGERSLFIPAAYDFEGEE